MNFNFAYLMNKFQIIQIKFSATFTACGIDVLAQQLDNRMSNFDFTLGLLTNYASSIWGGIETQDWATKSNKNQDKLWIGFNKIYPYAMETNNWIGVGKYLMVYLATLLNFKSRTIKPGLGVF